MRNLRSANTPNPSILFQRAFQVGPKLGVRISKGTVRMLGVLRCGPVIDGMALHDCDS